MRIEQILLVPLIALIHGSAMGSDPDPFIDVRENIAHLANGEAPGLQYVVVDAHGVIFEHVEGLSDINRHEVMTLDTTLMAYSMTKTITAIAVLQLAEKRKLGLDDPIDNYLTEPWYGKYRITIRQLLSHTSGIPNPLPLRWVHLADETSFAEDSALEAVVNDNPKLTSSPGDKFAYSNIGYWLLGKVVEKASGQSYSDYVRANILFPLKVGSSEMTFTIPAPSRHASGYLKKYSLMNLVAKLVIDDKFRGGYEGNWLRLKNHYVNGPSFGGLIGTARGFGRLLQDQLQDNSILLGNEARRQLEEQQTDNSGTPIPMTLGWHISSADGELFFFKEGGGGGFHCEMRLYKEKGIATVVMTNGAGFNTTVFLNRIDKNFFRGNEVGK